MKFTNYDDLIAFAKSQTRTKGSYVYYEAHHIIPKHDGGTDNKSNIVLLTLYEHLLAHYLLAEKYENIDKRRYFTNISACIYILAGCKKHFQTIEAKEYLQSILDDPDCKELQNLISIKSKKREPPIKGKCFVMKNGIRKIINQTALKAYEKNGWINQVNESKWAQINNQKPIKFSIKSIDRKLKEGYTLIDKCPICGKENSEENWCCCNEHLKLFEKERKENASKVQSEFLKNDWAKENSSRKNMKKVRSGPSKGERTWVHKGDEIISIKSSELDYYKSLGYERGRIHTYVEKVKKPKEKREFVKLYNNGEIVDENEFNKVQYRQQYFMICSDCGKKVSKIKRGTFQKFSPYCPICGRKHTNLKRFGATSPAGSKEVQEKMKKTCLERYGSEYLMQCKELMEKAKATKYK